MFPLRSEFTSATGISSHSPVLNFFPFQAGYFPLADPFGEYFELFQKGLAESGWNDIQGLGEFLSDPVKGLKGLQTLISSEEARAEVGDAVIASLNSKINNMRTALTQGGDENAELLGKELGSLIWQVGSVVTGVAGAAKGGVTLAKVGVNISKKSLELPKRL